MKISIFFLFLSLLPLGVNGVYYLDNVVLNSMYVPPDFTVNLFNVVLLLPYIFLLATLYLWEGAQEIREQPFLF